MSKGLFLWVFSLGECPHEVLKQSFLLIIFTAGILCDTGGGSGREGWKWWCFIE